MSQVVQIPIKDWKRIERILVRLDGEKKAASRAEWLNARDFGKRTGKTKYEIQGLRERHPEMVKPVPGKSETTSPAGARYLYNWTAYSEVYLTK